MATGQAGIRRGWRGLGMGTAGVVALASAGLAGAQEAPDDVTLATIVVEGEGATTEGTDSYAATGPTSTATGLPLTLRETPQSVSVVTRQELDDRDIRTLQDVVQATPGLSASQNNGEGRWRFYARGSEITNLQFDGIPVRNAWWGQESNANETAVIDRVEVVRGATGLIEGVGTPSASINQVRKRPGDVPALSAESGFGLEGNATMMLDGSAPLNASGSLRGRIVGYGAAGDTTRDDQFSKNGLVYGAIDADIGDRTTVGLGLSHQADRIDGYSWGGFWTRTDGSFFDFSDRVPPGLGWEYIDRRQTIAYADIEHRLDTGWTLRGALRASTAAVDRLTSYGTWDADGVLTRGGTDYDMTEDTIAFDARASGSVTLFGRTHELVFGTNGSRVDADFRFGRGIRPRRRRPGAARPVGAPPARLHRRRPLEEPRPGEAVGALCDRPDQPRRSAEGGGRRSADLVRREGCLPALHERPGVSDHDLGRRGAHPLPGRALRCRPGLDRLCELCPDLRAAERGRRQWQRPGAGDRQQPRGGREGRADGRAPAGRRRHLRHQPRRPAGQCRDSSVCVVPSDGCSEAAERINTRGVDLEVTGAVTDRWNLTASYTYATSEYAEGPNDGMRYGTDMAPDHLAKLATTYRLSGPLEQLTLGGSLMVSSGLEAQGNSWTSGLPYHIRQPGYAVVDVMARYDLRDDTEVQLNVGNLFDRDYYSSISDPGYGNFIGAPRTVALTLRHRF